MQCQNSVKNQAKYCACKILARHLLLKASLTFNGKGLQKTFNYYTVYLKPPLYRGQGSAKVRMRLHVF